MNDSVTALACLLFLAGLGIDAENAIAEGKFCDKHNTYLQRVYQCEIATQNMSNTTTITNVKGYHVNPNKNRDVRLLNLNHIKSVFFPRGFGNLFVNLEGIQAINIGLQRLIADDLKEFPKLKYLDVADNKLKVLKSDLFAVNLQLEYADFSKNHLRYIGPRLIEYHMRLCFLNFEYNRDLLIEARIKVLTIKVNTLKGIIKTKFTDDEEAFLKNLAKTAEICEPLMMIISNITKTCESDTKQREEKEAVILQCKNELDKYEKLNTSKSEVIESLQSSMIKMQEEITKLNLTSNESSSNFTKLSVILQETKVEFERLSRTEALSSHQETLIEDWPFAIQITLAVMSYFILDLLLIVVYLTAKICRA